jgi:threonine dehydrogenase-like Zn-dependent dehydrogenase
MRIGAGSVVAGAATKITLLEPAALWGADRAVAPSDRVRFAAIGTGTRGCELLAASLAIPGIECVAVCDLYDSRHEAAQEAVQKQVPATRNYREILDRNDVDAKSRCRIRWKTASPWWTRCGREIASCRWAASA